MNDLFVIGHGASGKSEARSNGLFVARVNVIISPYVNRQGHSGIRRSGERHQLRLAQLRPVALAELLRIRAVGRELHEQEREIALPPERTPVADHHREETAILISASGVRFALIPDHAL